MEKAGNVTAAMHEVLKTAALDPHSGLTEKFWKLIYRYYGELVNQALSITGNLEDAEDVVQETFCEVIRNPDKLSGVRSYGAWLRTLNRVNALDRVRGRSRDTDKNERMMQTAPLRIITTGGFNAFDTREFIASAIDALPEKTRAVAVLYYWQHVTVEDIASRLKIPPRTVRHLLLQAHNRLYEKLQIHIGIEGVQVAGGNDKP